MLGIGDTKSQIEPLPPEAQSSVGGMDVCWRRLPQALQSPLCASLPPWSMTSRWCLEIDYGGSIYTMKTDRCHRSLLFPESWLLNIYQYTTACEQLQYADKSPHQIEGGTKQAGTDSTWRAKEARFMQSVEGWADMEAAEERQPWWGVEWPRTVILLLCEGRLWRARSLATYEMPNERVFIKQIQYWVY